ncbi:MAG: hypothetical protein R2827_07105 [Bdellovibrionales bacterium]
METERISRRNVGPGKSGQWGIYEVPKRVDAFNFEDFSEQLKNYVNTKGPWVALDCSTTTFLSLIAIKFISEQADILVGKNGGMAIIGPTEKLKRQISIYATLDNIMVVSDPEKLSS